MAQTHDDPIGRARGNLETGRKRFALDDQRVIAPGRERPLQSGKNRLAIVLDFGCFAMKYRRRAHNSAAKDLANRLMAQANSQNWDLTGKSFDDPHRLAGPLRRSGAGRDYDSAGPEV